MSETTKTPSSPSLRDSNRIVRRTPEGAGTVTAASLFAVWILLPLALGALAYVIVGVWLLMSPFDRDLMIDWKPWIALTLVLQAGYWTVVSRAASRNALNGLWGLIPIIALVPTFAIARAALLKNPEPT